MTKTKKSKRGGNRPGQGRKSIYGSPMLKRTITLSIEHIQHLLQHYKNLSAGIHTLIDKDIRNADPD